jgi:four helix bundle protein
MFRFEDLQIWRRAVALSDKLFDLADQLEESKKFRMAEQLRGAVLSISNNIAEGSGSSSKREFKQFLNFSRRSVFETANMLVICNRLKYVANEQEAACLGELEEISKMIIGFSRSL